EAMTVPPGVSAGSLQVSALSPMRAAVLPLIFTVALPAFSVALSLGVLTNEPPIGTCPGVLVAVLPSNAAGEPSMLTSFERLPSMIPENGCGPMIGGAVPGGWIWCVSTAMTRSPFLAAG